MAGQQITQLPEITTTTLSDKVPIQKASNNQTSYATLENLLPASSVGSEKLTSTVAFALIGINAMSCATSSFTRILWASVDYDYNSDCNLSLSRFYAPYDGIYHFEVNFRTETTTGSYRNLITLYINGSESANTARLYDDQTGGNGTGIQIGGSATLKLTAGDYIVPHFWHNIGSTRSYSANSNGTYYRFAGHLIGRI